MEPAKNRFNDLINIFCFIKYCVFFHFNVFALEMKFPGFLKVLEKFVWGWVMDGLVFAQQGLKKSFCKRGTKQSINLHAKRDEKDKQKCLGV
jgi:hypothetical protein